MPDTTLVTTAEATTRTIVAAAVSGEHRVIAVDSPPGAGKSRLVREIMAEGMACGVSALVAVQTNAQAIDLVVAMANELAASGRSDVFSCWPSTTAKSEYRAIFDWLRQHPNVDVCESTAEANDSCDVLVAVAAKWGFHCSSRMEHMQLNRQFQVGIVDEAFQMPARDLMRFGDLVERVVLVGDPGQLEPFTVVDDTRWRGLDATPLTPAPHAVAAVLGASSLTRYALPASFRLDHRAAPLVRDCFYPQLPFQPVAGPADRGLTLAASPIGDAADRVLDVAVTKGWGLLELPAGIAPRDDPQVAEALAAVGRRLLDRGPRYRAEWPAPARHGLPLESAGIAIAVAHRDQRARVQELLRSSPRTASVTVDTANRLQGREFEVVLVWHPLSGRIDTSAFHLDTGRLCVMASRHRQACIVVARAGIQELLDSHLPSGQRPKGARDDREHDGWRAHRRLIARLPRVA